jgi:hypothetical protein
MDQSMSDWLEGTDEHLSAGEREERERALDQQEIDKAERTITRLARDYPLYVCSHCHRVDGWVDQKQAGICLHCLTVYPFFKRVERPLRYDPLLSSLLLSRLDRFQLRREIKQFSDRRPPLWSRALKLVGAKRLYELRALRNWQRFVSGWEEAPPLGAEELVVWGAEKFETLSPDGNERLIVFKCGWYWWKDGRWVRRKLSPYPFSPQDTGSVFSATLPVEQLVSAWADFQEAVKQENEEDWRRDDRYRLEDREQRALAEQQAVDKRDRLRAQEGVVEIF